MTALPSDVLEHASEYITMNLRFTAQVVVAAVYAGLIAGQLTTSDVQAQVAQPHKDVPANIKGDANTATEAAPKREQQPEAPASKSTDSASTAPATASSATANTSGNPPAESSASTASEAGVAGTTPSQTSQPPTPVNAQPSGAEVTTGSGLFEQSQAATASAAASDSSSGAGEKPAYELGGYMRGDMYVGKDPDMSRGQLKAGYGEFALKFQAEKEKFGDAYAELRLRDGIQGNTRGLILDLREAYVNTYLGPLDLRFGKQIIVWGRADAFNPTNNLMPYDLRVRSPVEDDRRVGNIGARAFLNFSPFRLEGVWMPLYVPAELPIYRLPTDVYFTDPQLPNTNLDNGLGAGRLHLETSAIDMSVSFVHGYAPLPGLRRVSWTWGVDPTVILIARSPYQQNVVGFDFSTTIADWLGVRGEAAYRRPVGYQTRMYAARPDLQYVLGIDHTFGSVSVIVQYLGRRTYDWQKAYDPVNPVDPTYLAGLSAMTTVIRSQVNDQIDTTLRKYNQIIFGQTEQVQHLTSLRLEWLTLNETLSLSALGLVNLTTHEWLAYPKISYKISDRLSTAVGGEIYWGPDGTLFGLIKEVMSAGFAEMRYAF